MPFFEAIRLAIAQLRVEKLKSFFTLLGVLIGVSFLIAVVSIVDGMGTYVRDDFFGRVLGTNTFVLRSRAMFTDDATDAARARTARRQPIAPEDVPPVVAALPQGTRWAASTAGFAFFPATSEFARQRMVQGVAVDGDYFTIRNYKLSSGRAFTARESESGVNVVVIGSEVATYFFPSLDPLGRELRIRGNPFTVVGVIERQGSLFGISLDRLAIAPLNSPLGRLASPRGYLDGIIVQAANQMQLGEAMETTREVMRSRRQLRPTQPDNFVMETSEAALVSFNRFLTILAIAGAALPAIAIVVGGMVVMNIMLVAVAERTREIGIRRAIGATRSDIQRQFLVESATISTVGAMLGISLGILIAKGVEAWTPLPASIAPWSIAAATLLGTVVGIVAGVYPATRASRLDPIDALGRET
jgi:putative ABC transport system permease protein